MWIFRTVTSIRQSEGGWLPGVERRRNGQSGFHFGGIEMLYNEIKVKAVNIVNVQTATELLTLKW